MIDVDFITLEDGMDYAIVDEIVIDNNKYLYLVEENSNKVDLRKLDEDENLEKVLEKNEYDKAMIEFAKIHKNDLAS